MMDCTNCEHFSKRTFAIGVENIEPCVLSEIKNLWALGIETVCSCCGHGDKDAAFIVVDAGSADRMAEIGYERIPEKYGICTDCGVFFKAKME